MAKESAGKGQLALATKRINIGNQRVRLYVS